MSGWRGLGGWRGAACALAGVLLWPTRSTAQGGGTDNAQELAKKLANPVSDMVSVPFQFNWENGVGPDQSLRTVLNIQPVLPIPLTKKWTAIERWIMPYVSQPDAFGSGSGLRDSTFASSFGARSGLSDITFSSFFSPVGSPSLVWGIGPVLSLPMTSDPLLGSGQWSAGPTFVVVKIQGPILYGILFNQLWSFATVSSQTRVAVNQAFFQPFLALTTANGMTFTLQSESTANWNAPDEKDTWTIPVNLLVSKLTRFGPYPFSVAFGAGVYAQSPEGGPEWKLRSAFTLLLPNTK